MLQKAYFLVKIGADTAENEQHFAEILQTDAEDEASTVLRGRDGLHAGDHRRARRAHRPPRRPVRGPPPAGIQCIFEKIFNAFFENFVKFWRARSRLYQNEILQENMRLTAFFKLYKICILLHRCNLKI